MNQNKANEIAPNKRVALFGKAFTSDLNNKWAEVIIYENDKIIYVGDRAGAGSYINDSTQKIELDKDNLILPGFIDTHIHYLLGGLQVISNFIEDTDSFDNFKKQMKELLEKEKDKDWIFAYNYIDTNFPDQKPNKKYLDELCSDKPIILMRYDNHTYLVNSKALEIANITKDTKDPPRGVVEKDENGEPTGCLHERAMDIVAEYFPQRDNEEYIRGLKGSAEIFLKEGITSCTDALVKAHRAHHYNELYSKKSESDKLPRAAICILWNTDLEERIKNWKGENFTLCELLGIKEYDKLKINTVKFLVDGVLESKTAAVEEPYLGNNNDCGIANFKEEQLNEIVAKLHANGIQAHFHAIGDKAVRMALDAVEYAKKKAGNKNIRDPRHYIAHNQLIKKRDYKRFKELGVCANFSPMWFCTDSESAEIERVLGVERAALQYPIKDLMNAGAIVTFGADWPVTSLRPTEAIETALTRKLLNNADPDEEPWCPEQRLTVEEALINYTINGAYVSHRETFTGSLEVGKKADIVVLDKNIFESDPFKIHESTAKLTIVDGIVLHSTMKEMETKNVCLA